MPKPKPLVVTGTIQRKWPVQTFSHGVFNTQLFSVITEEKETYFFKVMSYGKTNPVGNLHIIHNSEPGDVVKVEFKIMCKTTAKGIPITELQVKSFETLLPIGQEKEARRKEAVKKLYE